MNKYFKPDSLTWWASLVPLVCGIIVATEPIHGMTGLAMSITNGSGMTAPALITAGLGGIGLRGAIK